MSGVDLHSVPLRVRVLFAHGVLQSLAESQAVDLLHIKGFAADSSLRAETGGGGDADVLVRPLCAADFVLASQRSGWRVWTLFEKDSDLGAAGTLLHPDWGIADVHRFFPGIGATPEVAFERLWRDRQVKVIAGIPCWVPSVPAQAVILVLNAARSQGARQRDVDVAWVNASPERRREMTELVADLQAEVAFAAGIGELERFRGAREYDLWRIESQGGTRIAKWRARIKAAPTVGEKARLALRAPLVNTDHVAVMLGRPPTRLEVLREFFARPARGVREEGRALLVRLRERRR